MVAEFARIPAEKPISRPGGWGSTVIHIMLGKQPGGEHLPTPRTIRRWLAESHSDLAGR